MAIKVRINSLSQDSFLFDRLIEHITPEAQPKIYRLVRDNDRDIKTTVSAKNVHTNEILFAGVGMDELEVNGTTYTSYEELSTVLTPILFKKGGGSGSGGTTVHNDLTGLQGGKLGEYYHLTQEEYENLNVGSLTEEFIVTAPAGSYENGETFPAGMTLAQAFHSLLTDTFYPTFVSPSFSLSTNAGNREVGETISLNMTGTFNRGIIKGAVVGTSWNPNATQDARAGLPSSYIIDGTTYTTSALTQTKNIVSYQIPMGTNTINGSVQYTSGPQPKDSTGANYSTPLPSGSLSSSTTVTGYLRRFAGSIGVLPTNGLQVRTSLLGTSVLNTGNNFSFTTGTTNKIFVIAVPSNKNLVSVVNSGTNENLTSGFILTGITTIPDAGGTDRNYKVYIMENAVPFSTNYTINVILS